MSNEPPPPATKSAVERLLEATQKSIAEARLRIGTLIQRDGIAHDQATRFVRVVFILVGALIAGAAQFLPTFVQDKPEQPLWIPMLGVFGSTMVFLGGLWLGIAERTAPEALEQARRTLDQTEVERAALKVEFDNLVLEREGWNDLELDLSISLQASQALVTLYKTLHEVIENIVRDGLELNDGTLNQVLEVVGTQMTSLIGFETDEYWTLTVFRVGEEGTENAGRLVCAATRRPDPREERKPHMTWGAGEGVGGHALMTGRETVVADMTDVRSAGWVYFPNEAPEPNKYRSLAAVPIRVSKETPVWGMVIATSDEAGRFEVDDQGVGSGEIEPLRALAGMLSLVVARDMRSRSTTG